ncbi:MAG: hypothetical protein H6Q82_1938, partial [Deltaproteobacteria bacterium]|nr:hypothetical protein [Deltaproteobacteria bacterium]
RGDNLTLYGNPRAIVHEDRPEEEDPGEKRRDAEKSGGEVEDAEEGPREGGEEQQNARFRR